MRLIVAQLILTADMIRSDLVVQPEFAEEIVFEENRIPFKFWHATQIKILGCMVKQSG